MREIEVTITRRFRVDDAQIFKVFEKEIALDMERCQAKESVLRGTIYELCDLWQGHEDHHSGQLVWLVDEDYEVDWHAA